MPILPSIQHFITSEETEFEAPASESTMQNIGEAVNYLNDILTNNFQIFTSNGSVAIPSTATKVIITACGGGGGGGGNGSTGAGVGGGLGGGGAVPRSIFVPAIPGDTYNVIIGAGGAGGAGNAAVSQGLTGASGGNTIISNTLETFTFYGAGGGGGGSSGTLIAKTPIYRAGIDISLFTLGGNISGSSSQAGQASIYAIGGSSGGGGFGPGTGGGAGRIKGGNGGANNTNGASANANSGGGGGGGGGLTATPRSGGSGGSGYCFIAWF